MVQKGTRLSDETRQKISDARKGKPGHPHTEETKRKMSESRTGKKLSESAIQKLKSRIISEETRRKISEAKKGKPGGMTGKTHSPETRQKISAAQKGKPGAPCSEETRRKMSEAKKGKPKSEEHRRKLADANRGRTHSEETRRKMSEAHKGKKPSEETRRKLSEVRMGHQTSEETKRKIREANLGKRCGPDSPGWRGGVSFEPYCIKFNNEFKERVRAFFGRVCVECGVPENGRKLHVHHVNYRKDACCAEGVVPLFVTLCQSCHSKTTFNREYWEARYTALINEQYGGRCYLPKQDAPAPVPTT